MHTQFGFRFSLMGGSNDQGFGRARITPRMGRYDSCLCLRGCKQRDGPLDETLLRIKGQQTSDFS